MNAFAATIRVAAEETGPTVAVAAEVFFSAAAIPHCTSRLLALDG